MRFPRVRPSPLLREFWRGLTTPSAGVLKLAAVLFLGGLALVSVLAGHFRAKVEAGEVDWRATPYDFCRSSVMAVRGAARETDPAGQNLIFVGPSALRCWLPHPDETSGLATAAAGARVQVRAMCGNRQSYALTAALIDRFGAEFDGWFVIGVARQAIGRQRLEEDLAFHRRESRTLAFDSEVLRGHAAFLGCPQARPTGWELWDRRAFHYQSRLGWKPLQARQPYQPYLPALPIPADGHAAGIRPLDRAMLDRHLAVLQETVARVRANGRARVALVETPWVDAYSPAMQTQEWRRDEDTYREILRAWSQQHQVPWLTPADAIEASTADFSDPRHVGSPHLRRQFLEVVTRKLIVR